MAAGSDTPVNKINARELDQRELENVGLPPSLLHRTAPEPGPARNRILQALAPADRTRLLSLLQPVTFELGDVICESGAHLERIYFPTTAVITSLYTTEDGSTVEMGLAGHDGV